MPHWPAARRIQRTVRDAAIELLAAAPQRPARTGDAALAFARQGLY